MIYIGDRALQARYIGDRAVTRVYQGDQLVWKQPTAYITFQSSAPFEISTSNNQKNWDGRLEWSVDTETWVEWTGVSPIESANGCLYVRGTGNSYLTGTNYTYYYGWELTGSDVNCSGNIMSLLDWRKVILGEEPLMANRCFRGLFYHWNELLSAPSLPAMTLKSECYRNMFNGCAKLKKVPVLPAEILPEACYNYMFANSGVEEINGLRVSRIGSHACNSMYRGCSNIKVSEMSAGEYDKEYRIPMTGTATVSTFAFKDMFVDSGGSFCGTPTEETRYYTANTII